MSTNKGISPHAHTFTQSYAHATSLAAPGTPSSLQASATAMSTHYLPNLISFTLGSTTTITTPEQASSGTLLHLQKLVKTGVGADIRMIRFAVKEVGEFAATVFVTWEVRSRKEGVEAWRWRNAYGYRRMPDPEGDGFKEGFEYIVSDEEVAELVKRVPAYFEL